MELIDKDKVAAEIKKRRDKNARNKLNVAAFEDNYLLSFLNTIDVKKDVDLKEDVDKILYENDWDYDEIDYYEFAKHFFELGLAQKDLTLSNYDEAMITTITNALNYLEELNDSKGHDNVPSQYQSEKDWLKSLKAQKGE